MLATRIVNLLGKPFGINPIPRSFPNEATVGVSGRGSVFDAIYRQNLWASSETKSGKGSELAAAARYRERLTRCLAETGIKRIFDAPCGDLHWIEPVAARFEYEGGDISRELIADLKVSHPNVMTRVFDICETPFQNADVWHCRDCLFHLPLADIRRAFENFARSSIRYALLTTHKTRLMHRNLDVPVGGFRYLDLERPPFSLPRPIRYLRDYNIGSDFPRYVGLWRREDIAQRLRGSDTVSRETGSG